MVQGRIPQTTSERRPRLSLEEGTTANQGFPFLFFFLTLPFIPIFFLPFLAVPFLSYVLHLAIITAQNLRAHMRYAFFREVWKCELHTVS